MLKVYGGIAAEFAYMVLNESCQSLESKAEQMSAELYARTFVRKASEKAAIHR
jgi:hypothetical protein